MASKILKSVPKMNHGRIVAAKGSRRDDFRLFFYLPIISLNRAGVILLLSSTYLRFQFIYQLPILCETKGVGT